jgi:hypothetical protein
MEALRPARREIPAEFDGHDLSEGFELPPMIDVNDIDDELEFSDDEAGLDSRPGSFLRNDGRGWAHQFGSAGRFTPSSELSRSMQDGDHSPTPSVEGGYNLFKPPYTGKMESPVLSHLRSPDPMYQQEDRQDGSRVSSLTAITGGDAAAMPIGSSSGEAAALRKGQIPLESPPVTRSQGYAGTSGGEERHHSPQQYSGGSEDLLQLPKRQWLDAGEESQFADADESSLTVMGPVLDGHQAQAQAASGLSSGLGLSGMANAAAGTTSSRPSHAPAMLTTSSAPGSGSEHNGSASHSHSPTSRLAAPSWGRRGSGRSSSSGSSRSRSEQLPHHLSQQQQRRREDRHVSGEDEEDEGASSQSEGECVSFRAKARRNGARSAT